MKKMFVSILATGLISFATFAPVIAPAQSLQDIEAQIKRRQKHKNDWRNIAIGSGVLSLLGLLNNDKTLTFVGAAGALYSLHRYEQDRKSQSQLNRARATYFSRTYFYRDGVRYNRKTVTKNGKKYYQFVRAR